MKTTLNGKLLALIVAGAFTINQAQSQTSAYSGTSSNNCTPTAGTAGTSNTSVGCGANKSATASSNYNVAVGCSTLYSNSDGDYNTMVGFENAKWGILNSQNTFIGYQAGNTAGYNGVANDLSVNDNVFAGYKAGYANTSGSYGVFCGSIAGTANTTGNYNAFFGYAAGSNNTTGGHNTFIGRASGQSATTASENTFLGALSGYSNTTGTSNVISGYKGGYYNATGNYNTIMGFEAGLGVASNNYDYNTFLGYKAGRSMTTGQKNILIGGFAGQNTYASYNTMVGYSSGSTNTTGYDNTFIGYVAGYSNTSGDFNTFVGHQAGYSNTTADSNVFIGINAGYSNTTGERNIAIGDFAGDTYSGNNNCTYLGNGADANSSGWSNCTAIGNGAVSDGNGYVVIGNQSVNDIGGWRGWTTKSDGRFKYNVKEDVKGLVFINKLRPVTYQLNTKKANKFLHKNSLISSTQDTAGVSDNIGIEFNTTNFTESMSEIRSGFIAQEVEQAAMGCGFTSSIVSVPSDTNFGAYGISYGEIVVPLVKAVQELSAYNENLEQRVTQLETLLRQCCESSPARQPGNSEEGSNRTRENAIPVELQSSDKVILYQNIPNPFGDGTIINYYLPETVSNAKIVFYDDGGKAIKEVQLEQKGNGSLTIDSSKLAGGMYSYSIIVNGKVADTKKMTRSR